MLFVPLAVWRQRELSQHLNIEDCVCSAVVLYVPLAVWRQQGWAQHLNIEDCVCSAVCATSGMAPAGVVSTFKH